MRWISIGIMMAAALAGCETVRRRAPEPVSLAIENVTVIDPETRRVLRGRSVYVKGDRIVAVVPASQAGRFAADRSLDGSGRYLIPGLMDMHVHLFLPEPAAPTLNLLLANGVTGVREMSSDCWEVAGSRTGCVGEYKVLQSHIASGEVAGPELLSLTSTMVMGPASQRVPPGVDPFIAPRTPEDGRRLARHLAGRGVDMVKTHDSIPTEAFFALLDEARTAGLEVAGHVPFGAGSLEAARRGYRSIEHARDLLYDCSGYGPAFRRAAGDFAERKAGAARPTNQERLTRTVDEHDPKTCAAFLTQLAQTGAYYVPTHVTREMEARAAEPGYRQDPRRRYVMPDRNRRWEADLVQTAALPPAERMALERFFRHGLEITRLAHRAGVPIMAGTDASDTMIFPGFSLHDELSLLARAGLTPMDALRAATTVPAAYLGRTASLGGIAAGKEADLVLLRADPLHDVRNTGSIEAVIADGRLYDRAALDALLLDVERSVATPAKARP
jgi:imidazolonepropionase-like amidohydrolase